MAAFDFQFSDLGGGMTGRPRVEATTEETRELRALARSPDREEADRARALLLSLAGWSNFRNAEAFPFNRKAGPHGP